MTQLPAAPAMTTLVEAVHLDAPSGAANAVVRIEVPALVLPVVGTVVRIEVRRAVGKTVARTEVLEAGQIARDSAVVRCWRRRSRGCPSPPSPKA
jgi:hypothetical protein